MVKKIEQKQMIDMNIMHAVFGTNSTAMKEYIELYVAHTIETLNHIKKCAENKDNELILKYFHQIKGSSGSSGFKKIYSICEKGEQKTYSFDWESVSCCCNEIEHLLDKLKLELKKKFK